MNAETLRARILPEIEFEIRIRPEDDGPEGYFASGDDDEDAETCQKIREDLQHNEWAWCSVEVRATWNGLSGADYLGGCSYSSEADFRVGGYFEDMKSQALEDLLVKVATVQVSE